MTILKASELEANTVRVLDRALESPQYVERSGKLLVITRADVISGVPLRPEGYFADAYDDPERADRERQAFAHHSGFNRNHEHRVMGKKSDS